jgi:hypothetical protein
MVKGMVDGIIVQDPDWSVLRGLLLGGERGFDDDSGCGEHDAKKKLSEWYLMENVLFESELLDSFS